MRTSPRDGGAYPCYALSSQARGPGLRSGARCGFHARARAPGKLIVTCRLAAATGCGGSGAETRLDRLQLFLAPAGRAGDARCSRPKLVTSVHKNLAREKFGGGEKEAAGSSVDSLEKAGLLEASLEAIPFAHLAQAFEHDG